MNPSTFTIVSPNVQLLNPMHETFSVEGMSCCPRGAIPKALHQAFTHQSLLNGGGALGRDAFGPAGPNESLPTALLVIHI